MDTMYADRFWDSPDGLKLHFRDYPARNAQVNSHPPILCMHGLTRNSRDFARLAEILSEEWRVIVPEMRGRGDSEYAKDSDTYNPMTYVFDVEALLAQESIERFVAIGTSLGGLMTMLMAAINPDRIAAAVLNDIGPVVDPSGIDRIREYVGQGRSYPSWMHAARSLNEVHHDSFPKFELEDWLEMAKRGMVVQQNGRIAFDYDMTIAEPFAKDEGAAPPDLWPAFQSLAGRPLLIVRGALSDLLTAETLAEMQRRLPDSASVTIPDIGHAPLLEEPEAVAAIRRLLAQVQ
ncbi:alpha/beta fold hydrolase [Pontixanthobacter gangjinensis]|uniref:Alpha/beta fold hydrolase n=1 Tax=Pontixanthobacter gangjinensis TaxID=1028742 RepID=A0A6I4SQU8_9SPHN|nr:alpha/beta hydrolase [Pontixanthobacter gangjinensis]MXO57416.1 alpha/beta fold hydrolase [Pontixanthobacter gangjinensis]